MNRNNNKVNNYKKQLNKKLMKNKTFMIIQSD